MNKTIAALLICAAAVPAFAVSEELGPQVPGPQAVLPASAAIRPIGGELSLPQPAAAAALSIDEAPQAEVPGAAGPGAAVPVLPAAAVPSPQAAQPAPSGEGVPAIAAADPKDKPTMASLKAELRSLSRRRWADAFGAGMIGARFHDAPALAAAESQRRLSSSAEDLSGKIAAKKAEISALAIASRPRVEVLKAELKALKRRRLWLVMRAGLITVREHDAPSYEALQTHAAMMKEAARLEAEIQAKSAELAGLR